jgi:flagellar basal body-associated protein FliL
MTLETILQAVVALVCLVSGVVLAARNAAKYVPRFGKPADGDVPVDDVRIVSDLATRLRSQGKTQAVQIALQLHGELLKPEASA